MRQISNYDNSYAIHDFMCLKCLYLFCSTIYRFNIKKFINPLIPLILLKKLNEYYIA